jgi:hypothetical protein
MLRYLAVAHASKCRVTLQHSGIASETIYACDGNVQGYPFANWDATQFPEPERFDVTRQVHNHLAFGFGPHSCIGQQREDHDSWDLLTGVGTTAAGIAAARTLASSRPNAPGTTPKSFPVYRIERRGPMTP